METLKDVLTLLYKLQQKDIEIFELKKKLKILPEIIVKKEKQIMQVKNDFEIKKAEYVKLNSLKKEKEALLTTKEATIEKHTLDLNTIKANDLYKNCLLEIEKAKADKSALEDEILQLMEDIDKEIVEANNVIGNTKENIVLMQQEREEFAKSIDKNVLSQYERIREGRDGQGLATIEGDSCSGCNMVFRYKNRPPFSAFPHRPCGYFKYNR